MEFHFLRPLWFLVILLIPLMLWILHHYLKNADSWQKIIDPALLKHLLIQPNSAKNYWPLILAGFIWLTAVFALAGPAWEKRSQPLYQNESAKIIVLDLSPAMLAVDLEPNRLTRAKYKVLDILKNYSEGQTGMVVFTSEAYTVSPLTTDTHTIALMVPDLSPDIMPVLGSNIGAGLTKAEKLLKQGGAKTGSIILATANNPTQADDAIAAQIHNAGFNISVLGVGTTQDVPISTKDDAFDSQQNKTTLAKLDIASLENLATIGGGRFSTFTNTNADINYLLQPVQQQKHLSEAKQLGNTDLWFDDGRWFILFILPLILISFRRGSFMELKK